MLLTTAIFVALPATLPAGYTAKALVSGSGCVRAAATLIPTQIKCHLPEQRADRNRCQVLLPLSSVTANCGGVPAVLLQGEPNNDPVRRWVAL